MLPSIHGGELLPRASSLGSSHSPRGDQENACSSVRLSVNRTREWFSPSCAKNVKSPTSHSRLLLSKGWGWGIGNLRVIHGWDKYNLLVPIWQVIRNHSVGFDHPDHATQSNMNSQLGRTGLPDLLVKNKLLLEVAFARYSIRAMRNQNAFFPLPAISSLSSLHIHPTVADKGFRERTHFKANFTQVS